MKEVDREILETFMKVEVNIPLLDVVPIDFDVIQWDCTNHVAGSTYASDYYAEVQVVEPISPSPLVPDIQLASSTPELKPLPDNWVSS